MPHKDTVEFSGRIPRETYRAFVAAIPIHGANTWFVNRAVVLFLEQITIVPGLERAMQHTINLLIEETLGRHDNLITRSGGSSASTTDLLESDRSSDR